MIKQIFSKKMLICFLMGFAGGLPLLLTLSTLQAWMKDANVDLGKIGMVSLIGMPYAWKFVWAPLFDRFSLPFLGRRRGWLITTQILLIVAIASMGLFNPASMLMTLAIVACLVAFLSASQDIVIDAYRREYLEDNELGLGSSFYIYGYRVAMMISGAGALYLADRMAWNQVYIIMGLLMIPAVLSTLWAPEPSVDQPPPTNFKEAVIDPFIEFFTRDKALLILSFILLYKVGDTMASNMTMPFYLEVGFTKTDIANVAKVFGFGAIMVGTFLGGVVLLKFGIVKCLYLFGVLQAISTAGFAFLDPGFAIYFGPSLTVLAVVIAFENISGAMGTSAYTAYMATQSNKKFTATQYSLLTSVMGVPRTIIAAPTGYMAQSMGWSNFFMFCAFIALPGMLCLWWLVPWNSILEPQPEVVESAE